MQRIYVKHASNNSRDKPELRVSYPVMWAIKSTGGLDFSCGGRELGPDLTK